MTIKSKILNSFICLMAIGLSCVVLINYACSSGPSNKKSKKCLWRIQSGRNTVYVLASLHYFKEECCPFEEWIERAFAEATRIVFEVHPDSASSNRASEIVTRMAMYQNGNTLRSSISDSTYRLTLEKAASLGINPEQLELFEPWFVSSNLASMKLASLNFGPDSGLDSYFFDKAKDAKKEILTLETFEYQITLFDEISAQTQELFLWQTLNEMDQADELMEKAIRAWCKGDVVELENALLKDTYGLPELYAKIFVERNKEWANKIERFLRDESSYLVSCQINNVG